MDNVRKEKLVLLCFAVRKFHYFTFAKFYPFLVRKIGSFLYDKNLSEN